MKEKTDFQPAPIALFVYKRADVTRQTLEALGKNVLAAQSELYIFSDGPKTEADRPKVEQTRDVIRQSKGFKEIIIKEQAHNQGLAQSVIRGVSEVLKNYARVIVLEDDLVTHPSFLTYMNQGLEAYENDPSIYSLSAYSVLDQAILSSVGYPHDVYFTMRPGSWGWATWRETWAKANWKEDLKVLLSNRQLRKRMDTIGNDVFHLAWQTLHGQIDSWATIWTGTHLLHNAYSVYPSRSLVKNIGLGDDATHTKQRSDYHYDDLPTERQIDFTFPQQVEVSEEVGRHFREKYRYDWKYRLKLNLRRWKRWIARNQSAYSF